MAVEQADLARRLRGKALRRAEELLDSGQLSPLAVLKVVQPADTPEIRTPSALKLVEDQVNTARMERGPLGLLGTTLYAMDPAEDRRATEEALAAMVAAAEVEVDFRKGSGTRGRG